MPRFGLAVAFVPAALLSAGAVAEISVTPSLWSRSAANDNRRLNAENNIGVVSNITNVQVESLWSDETFSVGAVPRFRLSRYAGDEIVNADDLFLNLSGTRAFERWSVQAQFDAEQEGTATTELTDSGRFDINVDRTTLAFAGGIQHVVSDRFEVNAFGGYTDVSFEQIEGGRFFDYNTANAGLGLRYALSDTSVLLFDSSISTFAVPENGSETTSYSFRAGTEHSFDESLKMTLLVGQNISRLDFVETVPIVVSLNPIQFGTRMVPGHARGSGQLVDLTVTREFEQGELNVSWNRAFSPSSQGARQKNQQVEGHGVWSMSSMLSLSIRVAYRERQGESDVTGNINALDIMNIDGQALYHLSRQWRAEFGYSYRRQSTSQTEIVADSHELRLGIRFSGEPYFFNR